MKKYYTKKVKLHLTPEYYNKILNYKGECSIPKVVSLIKNEIPDISENKVKKNLVRYFKSKRRTIITYENSILSPLIFFNISSVKRYFSTKEIFNIPFGDAQGFSNSLCFSILKNSFIIFSFLNSE